jgi:hypothetical protein
MHAAAFRQPDNAFDIDLDLPGIETDREPLGGKAVISGVLEGGTQFAHDLAQRSACFFLVRPAPEQADQPFTAFTFCFGQRQIAENGVGLLGPQFDRTAIESDGEASDQRYGKTRGGRLLRRRLLVYPFSDAGVMHRESCRSW